MLKDGIIAKSTASQRLDVNMRAMTVAVPYLNMTVHCVKQKYIYN